LARPADFGNKHVQADVAFPFLIAFAAAVALLPIPNLFNQILGLMARFVPSDSMGLVRAVLKNVVSSHGGSFLSLGIVLTIWAASGGFAALIEALNVAYDLLDKRSFLHRRLLAIGLAFKARADNHEGQSQNHQCPDT
jgi:membrane protein